MTKVIIIFLITLSFSFIPAEEEDIDVHERVKLLKHQIISDIHSKNEKAFLKTEKSAAISDNYDYEPGDSKQIVPILNKDEKKVSQKYKFKSPVTLYPVTSTSLPDDDDLKTLRSSKHRKRKSKHVTADIFYRRGVETLDPAYSEPIKGIHCLDLLTLYLDNTEETKKKMPIKMVMHDNKIVLNLVRLLAEETEDETKDEIYSILYQISNLPIRLFQWHDTAIKVLFNQITQDRTQNFRTVKRGLKKLFRNWHLDTENTTTLLRETRIFRPPCIHTSVLSGSTKTSKGIRYTKSKVTRKSCPPDWTDGDDSCAD